MEHPHFNQSKRQKNRSEKRVYQYATGRGGVPIGNESPMGDYENEDRVYQYASGRGGTPVSGEDSRTWERQHEMLHFGKGPKGWQRSDERIKDDACETLYKSHDIDASDIEVNVKDGCIFLHGTVESRSVKRMAEEAVENILGVRDVQNLLRIRKSEAPSLQ